MPAPVDRPPARLVPRLFPDPHARRPVAWRWERAGWAVARGLTGPSGDPVVDLAARLRRDLAAAEAAADQDLAHLKLSRRLGPLYAAWTWHADPDRTTRHLLEAYLLAGLAPDDAAGRCGLTPEAVVLFADLFFDVAGRLDQVGFVAAEALGRAAHPPLAEADVGTLWKLVGYLRGAAALEAVVLGGTGRWAEAGPAGAAHAVDELVRDALRCRALVTARAAGAVRDAGAVMGGYLKVRELDRDGAGGAAAAATLESFTLIQALGFAARYGGPVTVPEGIPAAEPRAGEQLAAALGMATAETYIPDTIAFPADRAAEAPGRGAPP